MTDLSERLERLQRSVGRLRAEVRALHARETAALSDELRHGLRRRGLIAKKVLHDGCLLPRVGAGREEFYQLLRHYSFRLFLRDVIKHREQFTRADLIRYCSPQTAARYLRRLVAHRLVRRRGAAFQLAADAISFGPTLEWFVATALQREFGIRSAWNVRLDAAPGGGDYDVIGLQEGICVYIETKSSPPRNIDAAQIRAFFDRLTTLRPDLAVFLNDTQLRMADKLVPLFEDELRRRLGRRAARRRLERLTGELFVARDSLFIANSEPDLVGNLGLCLAHYFQQRGFRLDGRA